MLALVISRNRKYLCQFGRMGGEVKVTLSRPKVGSIHVGVAMSNSRKAVQMMAIKMHHQISCPKVLMYMARF